MCIRDRTDATKKGEVAPRVDQNTHEYVEHRAASSMGHDPKEKGHAPLCVISITTKNAQPADLTDFDRHAKQATWYRLYLVDYE